MSAQSDEQTDPEAKISLQSYYDIADAVLTLLPLTLALAGSAALAIRLHAFH